MIIGKHDIHVCVPNWMLMSYDYGDLFWNTERLAKQLRITDAITIATAIGEIKVSL